MRQQNLVIALLLALFVMSTAIAEESANISTIGSNTTLGDNNDTSLSLSYDDEREAKDISYPNGAKVRLLELEKSITRNILIGTKVVGVLNASNSTVNQTKLGAILDEMESLLKEVKNTSLDGNRTELAKQYVGLKKEAISLSKEFRDEARPYINQTIRQDLAVTINLVDTASLRNLSEEIKGARCEFNANRLEAILGSLNATNPGLIGTVRVCNATREDITRGVSHAFRNLSADEKKSINGKARENMIKANIVKKEFIAEVKANLTEMHIERQRQAMESIQNRSLQMNHTRPIESINDVVARISGIEGRNGEQHGLRPIGTVVMPGGTRK